MRGPKVGSLQLCGLNATVSIVFIVDSPNRVCMDWIKQTNVLKRRKIWLSDQIGSDSGCDGGGGVTPRNPGSAAVPCPAMRSGLCPRDAGPSYPGWSQTPLIVIIRGTANQSYIIN